MYVRFWTMSQFVPPSHVLFRSGPGGRTGDWTATGQHSGGDSGRFGTGLSGGAEKSGDHVDQLECAKCTNIHHRTLAFYWLVKFVLNTSFKSVKTNNQSSCGPTIMTKPTLFDHLFDQPSRTCSSGVRWSNKSQGSTWTTSSEWWRWRRRPWMKPLRCIRHNGRDMATVLSVGPENMRKPWKNH